MKLVLGLYTQTSAALPPAVFKRAIGCIIKPVFTYVYNTLSEKANLIVSKIENKPIINKTEN